jgi:hypothetical protein
MNQGDPTGSTFAALDAIWQDGGLIFQYGPPQPRSTVLQIKFETQSLSTDDQGHPIPPFKLPEHLYYYIPRWKWPPGDPMSKIDREILVERGLFQMMRWAGAVHYLKGETRNVMHKELHRQLSQHLPQASPEYLESVAAYVVKMSVELRG